MRALLPMAAALFTGLFVGCLVMAVYADAKISRAQERMERRVRYWQAEAAAARRDAARLARRLAARDTWRQQRRDWP
jgi:hypothetical protein